MSFPDLISLENQLKESLHSARYQKVTYGMSLAFNRYGCTLTGNLSALSYQLNDYCSCGVEASRLILLLFCLNLDSKIHHNKLLNNILAKFMVKRLCSYSPRRLLSPWHNKIYRKGKMFTFFYDRNGQLYDGKHVVVAVKRVRGLLQKREVSAVMMGSFVVKVSFGDMSEPSLLE